MSVRNMVFKNGKPVANLPSGTIIRIWSKNEKNKITALVTRSNGVRILRLNNDTCAGGNELGNYKDVNELLCSVDKKWLVEITEPVRRIAMMCQDVDEKPIIPSTIVSGPSYPKPRAGDLLKAVDSVTNLPMSAVLLTNGNVLLVKYGDMPCTDFKVQYEYTMSQFMETYGINDGEISVQIC